MKIIESAFSYHIIMWKIDGILCSCWLAKKNEQKMRVRVCVLRANMVLEIQSKRILSAYQYFQNDRFPVYPKIVELNY